MFKKSLVLTFESRDHMRLYSSMCVATGINLDSGIALTPKCGHFLQYRLLGVLKKIVN